MFVYIMHRFEYVVVLLQFIYTDVTFLKLVLLFAVSEAGELSRLKRDFAVLQEELAQCKADKEFVWSLWKRLQVANPDVAQAISTALQQ